MSRISVIFILALALAISAMSVYGDEPGFTSHQQFVTQNVGSNPVDFSGAPTSGRAPLMVMFSDLSKGNPSGWVWDFGDGYSSGGEDPVHTYANGGVYTVRLTVQYPDGSSKTQVKEKYIQVNPLPLEANFSAAPQSGKAPLTVQFSDLSTGGMVWFWDFGDGSPASSIPDPSHTFTGPGSYSVTLKISNEQGESKSHKMDIQVLLSEPLSAEFVGTPRSGAAPLSVQFSDKSSGEISSWIWDFGDGTRDSIESPTHTYIHEGTYPVTLTIRDNHGNTDTEEKLQYVSVRNESPLIDSIPISAGWNFVSVPKNLAPGKDTAQIFEHIDVAGHSALQYEPSQGWVPLLRTTQIKPFMAFWIYSAKTDSVPLSYDSTSQKIQPRMLSQGWNAVGFSEISSVEARKALSSIRDEWQDCLGFNATLQRYDGMIVKGVNDETAVHPFEGYWVYMSKPGTISEIKT
ncbi:PKD domain-containing protein [Methanospirillum lacunae]|uniref:PKD domain-containing protein n=1 Tax=Methanospirillum lacunae TaxID=668570 RepID=A0A2V2N3C0_9EURY|nr:PKD domain-containing protein [Methanospirillum lacunae]PWR69733.1 hypothetical protein DK846_17080 [Methanospirillum lacunae]